MMPFRTILGADGPFGDRLAFAELDHAMRAAATAFATARHTLATAVAEKARETERLQRLTARAADLEARAVLALRAGRIDLAEAAAQAIAALETECEATQAAEARFVAEVGRLRAAVERQRRRLTELDRGRRLARVDAAAVRAGHDPLARDAIGAAEAVLDRLRLAHARDGALAELEAIDGEALQDRMAEAGIGDPLRPLASTVLRRIEAKAAEPISEPGA